MSRRNYEQVCALARALDVIGERWTLLVVRELIFGPRRYSDILRELPGLGTNLLAQRLKDLEESGLIVHHKLPPPAASSVYELTADGRAKLIPIVRAMTDLGLTYLQYPPPPGDFVPVSSTMGALSKFFQRDRSADFLCMVEFHAGEDVFHCGITNGLLTALGFGAPPSPDLILHSTTDTFMGLVVGYITVMTALSQGNLTISQGNEQMATQFFDLFEGSYAAQ